MSLDWFTPQPIPPDPMAIEFERIQKIMALHQALGVSAQIVPVQLGGLGQALQGTTITTNTTNAPTRPATVSLRLP